MRAHTDSDGTAQAASGSASAAALWRAPWGEGRAAEVHTSSVSTDTVLMATATGQGGAGAAKSGLAGRRPLKPHTYAQQHAR